MSGFKMHCSYAGLKGFKNLEEQCHKETHLVDETARKRMKVLVFWEKHGLEATLDHSGVSERTLYNWKKKYRRWGCLVEKLRKQSTAPKNTRKRIWDSRIYEEIISIRESYPNLWKDKIYPLLSIYCDLKGLECPWVSTIWRLMKDLWWLREYVGKKKQTNKNKRNTVLRKPSELPATYPWQLVSLDSVEVRWVWWLKRYVVTVVDIYSRFSHAVVTSSHSSRTAMSIFKEFQDRFPFPVSNVLTDNGSEFKLHFSDYLKKQDILHYHTYPRCPKMNAHCERFNRTIREWVLNKYRYQLEDLDKANQLVREFLVFYNTKRVHFAFKNKLTPLQKLCLYDTINVKHLTAI